MTREQAIDDVIAHFEFRITTQEALSDHDSRLDVAIQQLKEATPNWPLNFSKKNGTISTMSLPENSMHQNLVSIRIVSTEKVPRKTSPESANGSRF